MAENVLGHLKQCSAHLPVRERDRVLASLDGHAKRVLDLSALKLSNKSLDGTLRVLTLLAWRPVDSEVCMEADVDALTEKVVGLMLSDRCTAKTIVLCTACLCAWGAFVPQRVVDFDFTAYNRPECLEACATLLLRSGTLSDLTEQALTASVWATYVAVDKGKRFSNVQRFTWPLLQQLLDVSSVTPPSVAVATRKVQEAMCNVLTSVEVKKGCVLPDGAKFGSGDKWNVLCGAPASAGYTEQQEVHLWAFCALPSLLDEGLGEMALDYASNTLLLLGKFAARGVFALSPNVGGCASLGFVESIVAQLMQLLPRLAEVLPRSVQELDGEVMGLFFQLLSQARKPTSSVPFARAHVSVVGWSSDDSASKLVMQSVGARSSDGVPQSWLASHVCHEYLAEAAMDTFSVEEGGRGNAGPVWRGEVLLSVLQFFAAVDSPSEGAVVEAFFSTPHWNHYIQSHVFSHSLVAYLSRNLHREAFNTVRDTLHLKLLRITALSPHSHSSALTRLLPRLISRTTYLDIVHRILDLPLLAHVLGRPNVGVNAANASKALSGGTDFSVNLVDALLDEAAFNACDEGAYAVFWAEHKHAVELWVNEIESRALSRKAETAAAHVPRLLRSFFALVSVEAERDPIMAVNVVSALLVRYHMLSLPVKCAREVRKLLLQEIYRLVSTAPQVLELVREELVTSVRQHNIGKRSHRCVHLTAAAAATLSQSLVNTLRLPWEPSWREPRQVGRIFSELHKAAFDVLSILYRRQAGEDKDIFATNASLYLLSDQRPSRRRHRCLHDLFEAGYTVWEAAESIDSLCVAIVTIAVHCPGYIERATACCVAVARACTAGVLPKAMYRTACLQLSWLKSSTLAATAVIRPCPIRGTLPHRLDGVGTIHALLPKRVAPIHSSVDVEGYDSADSVSST